MKQALSQTPQWLLQCLGTFLAVNREAKNKIKFMLQYLNIKRLLWFFIHYYSYCVCLIDKSFKIIEN